MSHHSLLRIVICALVLPTPLVLARGGGGRGGSSGGKNGGRGATPFDPQNPFAPRRLTPQEQAEQLRQKVDKLLSDGFAALKASDTAAALEDFSDVLQLQPNQPAGHLGMGLVQAQKGRFGASQTDFASAVLLGHRSKAEAKAKTQAEAKAKAQADAKADAKAGANGAKPAANPGDKPDPNADAAAAETELDADLRLANYNLAVSYARTTDKVRAMVLLDRMIAETKPTDEVLVNAQRSLVAGLDDKTQTSVAAMPAMLRTLETAYASLRTAHAPLRRWGVAWMASEEVSRHRLGKETEPLPKQLPFLLPEDEPLPEARLKPEAVAVNPLAPVVMGQQPAAAAPANPALSAVAPADPANPATAPTTNVAPAGETASVPAAAPGGGVQTAQPPLPVRAAASVRIVNGAGFAVAPDLLLTCHRLAAGATAIQVQSTDGNTYAATLVAADEASGLALIKVEGGHFTPLALADAARPGVVKIPAFSKPTVFGPELEILRGELSGQPAQMSLRVMTHPRSAGSPLTNERGQVVAILTATRDDPFTRLPVVPVDVIRKFAAGKLGPPAETTAAPERSVFEVSATRED